MPSPNTKHDAQSASQSLDFKDGKRLIAVSEELELIAAGTRSPADFYLEEEFNNLSNALIKTKRR